MALFHKGKSGRRHGGHGIVSAMIFNVSLFAMPFAGVAAWRAFDRADVVNYDATPAAKAQTRHALELEAAKLIPEGANRRTYWSSIVQRELDEGDVAAARGFILSAPTMLPPMDSTKFTLDLPPNATDDQIVAAALPLLDPEVRAKYERAISPLGAATRNAGDALQGAVTGRMDTFGQMAGAVASDFFVIGDLRDLAIQSARWVRNEPIDVFILTLSGVGVALTATTVATAGGGAPMKAAASVVKAAKKTGKLTVGMTEHLTRRLFEAVPPQRLKQELTAAFKETDAAGDQAAVVKAFDRSVDPAAFAKLETELTDIKAISDATSPASAVRLLEHAEDATDLKRLRLTAEAGGDRAVAVAKRADKWVVLRAAKGALKLTRHFMVDLMALGLALVGFLLSVLAVVVQALVRPWIRRSRHAEA